MELAAVLEMSLAAAPPDGTAEASLVAASAGGDPDAFAALVRRHQRRVFRLAGRFFRHAEDVEDVAQDTFFTAWRKIGTYRARAPFEHWLTRICLNRCYERLRRRKPPERPLDDAPEAAARSSDPGIGLEVERLLATLSPTDRFILLMLDGEGWSTVEIAERLGWSRTNVKVRAHRARKKLGRLLERGLES